MRVVSYWGLSLLVSWVAVFAEVPPAPENPIIVQGLQKLGTVPTDIFSAPVPGRLIVKVSDSTRVMVWEEANGEVQSLYDPRDLPGPYTIHYATSPSGKYLLVKEDLRLPPETPGKLLLFNMTAKKIEPVALGNMRSTSVLPVLAHDDSKFLLFGVGDSKPSAWSFPLSEYLLDVERNAAQPTGFYSENLPKFESGAEVKNAALSPDGTQAALILGPEQTENVRDPRFRNLGSIMVPRRSLRILDVATGEHRDVLIGFSMESLIWTSEDTLILKSDAGSIKPGTLYKFTISNKTPEPIDTARSMAEEASADGRWLIYIPVTFGKKGEPNRPANPYAPAIIELADLKTGRHYRFQGASSAVFTPDSQTLVFRVADADTRPFASVSLKPYLEGSGELSVDLTHDNPAVARSGFSIDRFAIPKDPALFADHFEVSKPEAGPFAARIPGHQLRIMLRNKSEKYFGVSSAEPLQLRCELVDETGKVWASSFVNRLTGPHSLPARVSTLMPGQSTNLTCVLMGRHAIPGTLKTKIVYSLNRNEKVLSGELALP